MMNSEDQELCALFEGLDTPGVSDAMDKLGLPGQCLGIAPLTNYTRVVVGPAFTVKYVPASTPAGSVGDFLDDVAPGDIVVIDNGGRTDCTVWGDIIANAAQFKGVRGTVLDGVSRDIEGSESIGYPVYGRGITMISARNRLAQLSAGEPIHFAGVVVRQDDFVIADRCGTVFVPHDRAEEVIELGERIVRRQDAMVQAVRAGRSVADVMHDKEFDAIKEKQA